MSDQLLLINVKSVSESTTEQNQTYLLLVCFWARPKTFCEGRSVALPHRCTFRVKTEPDSKFNQNQTVKFCKAADVLTVLRVFVSVKPPSHGTKHPPPSGLRLQRRSLPGQATLGQFRPLVRKYPRTFIVFYSLWQQRATAILVFMCRTAHVESEKAEVRDTLKSKRRDIVAGLPAAFYCSLALFFSVFVMWSDRNTHLLAMGKESNPYLSAFTGV